MLRENLRGPPGMLGKEGKTGAPGRTVSEAYCTFIKNPINVKIDCNNWRLELLKRFLGNQSQKSIEIFKL